VRDYIIFTIKKSSYAIAVDQIERISMISHLTPIPNSHPFVDGMMLYRNQTIKVVNFRKMIGMEGDEEGSGQEGIGAHQQKMLIYQSKEGFLGVKVDAIQDIAQIDESALKHYAHTVNVGNYLETLGVIEYKNRLVIVIGALKIPSEEVA
jgi:chemotaxis signal transduction protein